MQLCLTFVLCCTILQQQDLQVSRISAVFYVSESLMCASSNSLVLCYFYFVQAPASHRLVTWIRHDESALGVTEMFTWKKCVEFGRKFGSPLLSYITHPKSMTSGNAPATEVRIHSRIALHPEAFAFTAWIYVHSELRLLHAACSYFMSFPTPDSKSDFLKAEFHSELMYGVYSTMQLFPWKKLE